MDVKITQLVTTYECWIFCNITYTAKGRERMKTVPLIKCSSTNKKTTSVPHKVKKKNNRTKTAYTD